VKRNTLVLSSARSVFFGFWRYLCKVFGPPPPPPVVNDTGGIYKYLYFNIFLLYKLDAGIRKASKRFWPVIIKSLA
jgi:hypothetical protein